MTIDRGFGMDDYKTTRWHDDNGVATITLSRPQSHNAWTGRMHTELRDLLARAEDDASVRVVIITGDPDGATFCPGGDATALAGHAERGGYDPGTPPDLANPGYGVDPSFDADFAYLLGMETVTIAAVNGAAAGVGFALLCWCDLRFIASDAKLTSAHGRLNLPAEYGLSWILPRLVGRGRASDLLLSSRVFTGAEAEPMGLATEVVDRAEVMPTARAYADNLVATISPHALRATKRQLSTDAVHDDPARSVRDAQERLDQMMTERDYREAIAAYQERRVGKWSDS